MEHPVILFDGVCNLCNASVQFIIEHDPKAVFKFAALQSDFAKLALKGKEVDADALDSVVLIEDGNVYTKSSAALRIARKLSGAWSLMYGFYIIPPFIRDFFYGLIAKNRYRIWGKQESCWMPTEELKGRFLERG